MSEAESPAKKKVQNKNSKKKQNSKKNTPSSSGKQGTTTSKRGATTSRVGGLNNRAITQNRTMGSGAFPHRTMNTTTNMASGTFNSLSASSLPLNGGTTSVYGYGGLPIAAPPNNSARNYLSAQAHIPPAQRAGPYIPYFPHPKSS